MENQKLNMKKIIFFLLISISGFSQVQYGPNTKSTTPAQGSDNALVVRSTPQSIDRVDFSSVTSNSVDATWGAVVGSIGSGMDVDQTGGNLILTSGTTGRSETIIRSTEGWQGGVRLRARSTLSQRIANNNFFIELVDVIGDGLTYTISSATVLVVTIPSNPFTSANVGQSMYIGGFSGTGTFLSGRYPIASVSGNDVTFTVASFAAGTGTCSAFGWNYYQLQYQSTTATAVNFDTQRKGYASGVTAATINTTAAPGHLAIVTGNDLVATFSDQLVASGATIKQTVRATRDENIPDDQSLRLQIRMANGSTNPASNTTWTIGFVSVSNYSNQDVSIQDVRPMGVGNAVPVEILRGVALATQPVSGTLTAVTTVTTLANGQTAHSTASTGSPVRAGGRIVPTTIGTQDQTLVAGDAADVPISTGAHVITKPYATSEIDWHYAAAASGIVSTTTAVTFKAASGTAGIRTYLTSIDISAIGAGTATELAIRDGAAGTVIWRIQIPAAGITDPFTITFNTPLKGTANTLMEVVTLTSSATPVYFNAHGYTGF